MQLFGVPKYRTPSRWERLAETAAIRGEDRGRADQLGSFREQTLLCGIPKQTTPAQTWFISPSGSRSNISPALRFGCRGVWARGEV
jgi:hypothetical protein